MTIESTMDRGEIFWEGDHERLHIRTQFTGESLLNRDVIASTFTDDEVKVLPTTTVVHLGGASIMDQGYRVLEPLVEELVACRKDHRFFVSVGGGARERHIYAIGTDLGLPTGAVADIAWMACEQNAVMLYNLLAKHRGIEVPFLHFEMLPAYLREGCIPILMNMPHYYYWEQPQAKGRIPVHRPDTGAFLLSEVWAMKDCIYLKDVDGVFTADPKQDEDAELLTEATADQLLAMPDLPIERAALQCLQQARDRKSIRVINGHVPGNLTKALAGEAVGTLVRQ